MAEKTVTLVSKDGDHTVTIPESDAIEITQYRALGWATKPEHKEAEKAQKAAQ